MKQRLEKLRAALKKQGLSALFVSSQANIRYLTGYPSRESCLLVCPSEVYFITDFRYFYEARKKLKNLKIELIEHSFFKKVAKLIKQLGCWPLGFEAKHISYAQIQKIKEEVGKANQIVPAYDIVEDLRKTKDREEISLIYKATEIAIKALNFAAEIIRPGITEIALRQKIEHFIANKFGCVPAFEIIVASGPNSSYPHHLSSERNLHKNEVVLIDLGVDFCGYKSDLTRTFFLGKIPLDFKKIYKIVLEAQKRAIEKVRPGITADEVDKTARHYIAYKGYAAYFGHSTGHGIGLEVHEDPHLSSRNKEKLSESMVFTIEPAIYLPHKFGIRIEDMVMVNKKGCEVISGNLDKSI